MSTARQTPPAYTNLYAHSYAVSPKERSRLPSARREGQAATTLSATRNGLVWAKRNPAPFGAGSKGWEAGGSGALGLAREGFLGLCLEGGKVASEGLDRAFQKLARLPHVRGLLAVRRVAVERHQKFTRVG